MPISDRFLSKKIAMTSVKQRMVLKTLNLDTKKKKKKPLIKITHTKIFPTFVLVAGFLFSSVAAVFFGGCSSKINPCFVGSPKTKET